ncbi:unnamed protein product, partial [marine sediment metagenome]
DDAIYKDADGNVLDAIPNKEPEGWKTYSSDADDLIEHFQNHYDFFDNCVLEYDSSAGITMRIKGPEVNYIIIEGHDYQEVKNLFDEINGKTFKIYNKVSFTFKEGMITIKELTDENSILGDSRHQTGQLYVRGAEYFETLLKKMLDNLTDELPTLIGLDPQLDAEIAERLKK